jgi:adenylylsulfate kinase
MSTEKLHIVKQQYAITKKQRQVLNGNRSLVLWFTGLSGSGKSTLAGMVEEALYQAGLRTYLLDGDNIRHGLNNNVDFSIEGRKENIRRIGEVSKLFVDAGVIVLTAFISPLRNDRDQVRNLLESNEFIEIFVNCPVEICEARDVKGLYKKARAGEIKDFTGISSPFEAPLNPEITIHSDQLSPEEATKIIIEKIMSYTKL